VPSDEKLKEWLESRFQKIEQRIDELEMVDMGGQVGTEQLASHLGISRSVISEYLNRMEEEGLVKRDFNEDSSQKSRYVWRVDWNSLPPEIASRLRKK
jgi:predicted transcriptional regulator